MPNVSVPLARLIWYECVNETVKTFYRIKCCGSTYEHIRHSTRLPLMRVGLLETDNTVAHIMPIKVAILTDMDDHRPGKM